MTSSWSLFIHLPEELYLLLQREKENLLLWNFPGSALSSFWYRYQEMQNFPVQQPLPQFHAIPHSIHFLQHSQSSLACPGKSSTNTNEYGTILRWYSEGKGEIFRENPVRVPFFSLQIPHGPAWNQTRTSVVFKESHEGNSNWDVTLCCPQRNEDAATSLRRPNKQSCTEQ